MIFDPKSSNRSMDYKFICFLVSISIPHLFPHSVSPVVSLPAQNPSLFMT